MKLLRATALLGLCIIFLQAASAMPPHGEKAAEKEAKAEDRPAEGKKADDKDKKDEPKDTTSVTKHSTTIGGKEIK